MTQKALARVRPKGDPIATPSIWWSCCETFHYTFHIWNRDQNGFSFLDIKIIRNTEKKAFETSVYRKDAFSDVFTNVQSFILMTYKTGLLKAVISLFFNMLFLWKVSWGNYQAQINL